MVTTINRIGVISDTHGLLRDEVREILETCQVILHGGDIHKQNILDELEKIADVYAVRGNNDKEWAEYLPEILSTELYGVKIIMTHDKKYLPPNLEPYDLVVYGHSHQYEEKLDEGRLILNPGSCGPRRFGQPITMAVIEVEDTEKICWVERFEFA